MVVARGIEARALARRGRHGGVVQLERLEDARPLPRIFEPDRPGPPRRVAPECPQLFDQLVYRALAQELISESKAAELMRMPLTEFQKKRNWQDDRAAAH